MRTLLKYVISLPAVYLAAWTVAYAGMLLSRGDGLDFRYYFAYLGWAWTFRGGELPTYIFYFSLLLFLPLAVVSFIVLRRSTQKQRGLVEFRETGHKKANK
jgi:hypothetical protein